MALEGGKCWFYGHVPHFLCFFCVLLIFVCFFCLFFVFFPSIFLGEMLWTCPES